MDNRTENLIPALVLAIMLAMVIQRSPSWALTIFYYTLACLLVFFPVSFSVDSFLSQISRGRGRGTTKFVNNISYEHNIVDHRPTKLLVSGYEQDDKTEVIKHFEKFGEIVDYLSDDATPSLVLNYKVRKDAEVALTKGRNFHDRLLSVTWASHHNNIRTSMVTKPPTPLNRPATADEEELAGDLGENEEEDDAYFARLSPSYSAYDEKEAEEEGETERSWKR